MKKTVALLMALAMLLALTACGNAQTAVTGTTDSAKAASTTAAAQEKETLDWVFYWYLCGSDLETNFGAATNDLSEMMEVELPENVAVVIQTGGAQQWQNETMDEDLLQRWLYNSEGLQLIEEKDTENMGDPQTLADFLQFANENYPAQRVMVSFWNHGGGSVSGVAFDQLFGMDSLTLSEISEALNAVWPANAADPALELIGFDACLMATVDTAAVMQNYARYLVASEEIEPSSGWDYTGWLGALAADPTMDGEKLGRAICDSFYDSCEVLGTHEQVTLSLTDLRRVAPLLEAYEAFGEEAFAVASEDSGFIAELARCAAATENYGGNTRSEGYTNMLDLGHFARQTAWMLPSAQGVCDALAECVLYKVGGIYREHATGLSCYYSYSGSIDDFNGYAEQGAGIAFKHLYAYGLTGELADGGEEYIKSLGIESMPSLQIMANLGWEGAELDLDEETGTALLDLGPEAADVLSTIGFTLFILDHDNDRLIKLGMDNDLVADWEKGVFYDNFRGVWGALDDALVYMELTDEGDDYNIYAVPVLLNGERYNLRVVYDFTENAWDILGAMKGSAANGMAGKELRPLVPGDVVEPIWKLGDMEEMRFEDYTVGEVIVSEDTAFGEVELPDGSYMMYFDLCDYAGRYTTSDAVYFDCEDGEIWTTVYGEEE